MTTPSMEAPVRHLSLPGRIILLVLGVFGAGLAAPSGVGLLWFVPYAGVGLFLIIRRPGMSIGWLLFGLAACFALIAVTIDATVGQFADGTVAPYRAILASAVDKSGIVAFILFATLAIVFPSGHLPHGRWGIVARVALTLGLVLVGLTVVMPTIKVSFVGNPDSIVVRNPFAVLPDHWLWRVISPDVSTFLPILLLMAAAAISLVVRTQRTMGVERQQLRWFTASMAAVVLAVLAVLVLAALLPALVVSGVVWIPATLTIPLVPIAIGIAVTRYRLYEIDRIISRTIGWAIVSGVLVAIFAGAVLALQTALADFTQGQTLAVAASTLIAFAVFQPVRRRVQHIVDRRFDRARYDGERTAVAFAERMRDQVDLADLESDIAGTVGVALRPSTTGLWIRPTSRKRLDSTTP